VGGRPHHQDGCKYKQIDLYASDAAQINPQFYYTIDNPAFPDSIPYKAQFVKPVTGVSGVSVKCARR
jgi:hypothetical protein